MEKKTMSVGGRAGRGVYDIIINCFVAGWYSWCLILGPWSCYGYSVSGAYRILNSRIPTHDVISLYLLWRQEVPLKVAVFVWRLFHNRLPTKVNLFWRGIVAHESKLCVGGCGSLEIENYLFLECNVFGTIWKLVQNWMTVIQRIRLLLQMIFFYSLTAL